jgi:hypothetical protein
MQDVWWAKARLKVVGSSWVVKVVGSGLEASA